MSILRLVYKLRTLFLHDVYFEVCLHVVNFVPTRCLFWGLFTWCALWSYTMSILRCIYMLWTFFLYTMSILRFVYMLWTLFLHDVYFKVCLHVVNIGPTRYLFWGLFTCCELSFYTMSILRFVYMLRTLFLHDIYFEAFLHVMNFVSTRCLF